MIRTIIFPAILASLAAVTGSWAAPAKPQIPLALPLLHPGYWALRLRASNAPEQLVCLGDPLVLIQLGHGGASCNKYVIVNSSAQTVVNYSCPGGANGRTAIRVTTPRVIQIDTQGTEGGLPFESSYEGRRIGQCPIQASARR